MGYFLVEDHSHGMDGYLETHSFGVNDDFLEEEIWDIDPGEIVYKEEIKYINFMLNE